MKKYKMYCFSHVESKCAIFIKCPFLGVSWGYALIYTQVLHVPQVYHVPQYLKLCATVPHVSHVSQVSRLGLQGRQGYGHHAHMRTFNIDNHFQAKCAYKGRCLYLFLILQTTCGRGVGLGLGLSRSCLHNFFNFFLAYRAVAYSVLIAGRVKNYCNPVSH